MPLHVGVIANGHGLVLEHDVFYNVRNAVVFWNAEGGTSYRNAMRNCIVYGASMSGIWTVQTDGDDFDFRNNVIANRRVVWMRERGGTRPYKAAASVFADNANLAAYGAGAAGSVTQSDSNFLSFQETRLAGRADLVMDRGERDYLHIRKVQPALRWERGFSQTTESCAPRPLRSGNCEAGRWSTRRSTQRTASIAPKSVFPSAASRISSDMPQDDQQRSGDKPRNEVRPAVVD